MAKQIERKPWKHLDEFRGSIIKGEWPTFPELIEIQVKRFPDRPCFTDFEGPDGSKNTLTYSQVYEKIKTLAAYMIEAGVKKGDRVIVTGKNSPQWGIVYLATFCAGGIIVPVDNGLHETEAANLVRVSEPKLIFSDEEKFPYFRDNFTQVKVLSLSPKFSDVYIYDLKASGEVTPNEPCVENDTAAILFTSGTTGNPKGVMLSHKNLLSDCFIAQTNLEIVSTDVFYALLPIHHAYTMQAAFICPLSVGAEIVFGKSMAVTRLMKELREGKITIMLGVPLLYNKLMAGIQKGLKAKGPVVVGLMNCLEGISFFVKKVFGKNIGKSLFSAVLKQANIYTLRVAICGGGPLASSVFKKYNAMGIDFIQGYGLTETAPIITLNPVEHFKIESVGRDFSPYEEMKIVPVDGIEPGERGIGEIVVKGPMVMQGYYNMPEETAKMFTSDGFFKTGDLGWMDEEHYVMLCGRAKNLIVTAGGKNVYPEEIEDAFQLVGEVQQIVVQAYLEEDGKSELIEALIYPSDDCLNALSVTRANAASDEKVKACIEAEVEKVNKSLPPYAKITRVTVLAEPLAMTTTQKVKRNYKK
ncbi:MAG: AMP-binding protein [Treponema sp.]|nr:AMP-binding protein [Treponema sp.]